MTRFFRTGQPDKAMDTATKRFVENLDVKKHTLQDGKDLMAWAAGKLQQVDLSDPDARDRLEESLRQALRRERFDWRRWLLPGILIVVALAVLGATIVVSQLQIRQIRTDLEQLRTPQIQTNLEEIQNSLSELIRDEVDNAQSQYRDIPAQIATLSERVRNLEKGPVSPGLTPRPTATPIKTPEVAKSPTPTPPQPIQVTGHVYKDKTQDGIGGISVELKIWQQENKWSEKPVAQATTATDGAFTLPYTPTVPLPTPLKLQLIHSSSIWNTQTGVEGEGWRAAAKWVEGEFGDIQAVSPVTIHLAIKRSFSGQVNLPEDINLGQVHALLFRKQDAESQWDIAATQPQLNDNGLFALLEEPGVHPDAWYRVLIEVPDGFICTVEEESLFQPGAWMLADLMPEKEKSCGLETTGPVTDLAFGGAVFNVQKAVAELLPVPEVDGQTPPLSGDSWTMRTGPGDRFEVSLQLPGSTSLKVLGHTLGDAWKLAYDQTSAKFFWAGVYKNTTPRVNVEDSTKLPLIFQPTLNVPESQVPTERAPLGWTPEIVDGLEVYYAEPTADTSPVLWKLEGLEAGKWRLQVWVPKGHGQAAVSYEVLEQTTTGGKPLTLTVGSPEIDQSKVVDKSQFVDIGVYKVGEGVTVAVQLDALKKAQQGANAPKDGWTIGVGPIRAVRWLE